MVQTFTYVMEPTKKRDKVQGFHITRYISKQQFKYPTQVKHQNLTKALSWPAANAINPLAVPSRSGRDKKVYNKKRQSITILLRLIDQIKSCKFKQWS